MILPETFKEVLIRELNQPRLKGKKFQDLLSLILDDQNLGSSYPTQPGKPNLDRIRSTAETAFQRAIFNGAYSILQFHDHEKTIHWLDLELPVTLSANPRRKCVDLIGKVDHQPTLCELKFMNRSASDEPKYAILCLFQLEDIDFKRQKGNKETYKPVVSPRHWKQL
jgi:hypothetical protein